MKELNKKELNRVRESVNDIDDGQKFIEKDFVTKMRRSETWLGTTKKCYQKTHD